MADVINLRRERKRKARAEAEAQAARNRARHGRSNAERATDQAEKERASRAHDGHKIETDRT